MKTNTICSLLLVVKSGNLYYFQLVNLVTLRFIHHSASKNVFQTNMDSLISKRTEYLKNV